MKIAGWEVPQALIDAVARRLRNIEFDAHAVRAEAAYTYLLPRSTLEADYVRDEIGTRLIDYFKRTGQIKKVPGTRKWRFFQDSLLARITTEDDN